MARPAKSPEEQPVLMFNTTVRVYANEPEIAAYFAQFKPGQYSIAIKRAVRAALSGGGLGQGSQVAASDKVDDDDIGDFSDFVS